MKIILLFIITLSLDSFARMNPFEPTDTFNEKKAEYYKIEEKEKIEKLEKKQKQEAEKIEKRAQKKESFKILSFIKIEVLNNILTITVDKKYKLLNQDILKLQKKLLFDFRGNISFYTIRKNIKHKDFKSFAVGTHQKKNYFRVVIDLPENVVNYKEIIHTKKGIIAIQKIK